MSDAWVHELDLLIRSRVTLIYVVTSEEERVVENMSRMCGDRNRPLFRWDLADGLRALGAAEAPAGESRSPEAVLDTVEKAVDDAIFLLLDFHQVMRNQPRIIRKMRNLAQAFKYTRRTLVVTGPSPFVPDELRDHMVLLEVPPPDESELGRILDDLATTPGVKVDLSDEDRDRIIRSALGLSANQAQRILAKAIVADGVLDAGDLSLITSEKKQIIRESGALEFISPRETMADVGGLQALKEWLRTRGRAFSKNAREYGLPEPKGIALIGISGTGKSLTAKTIAGFWSMPLIRLDIGALFGSLVGQSEENTRRALTLVETIAPCVLWIDEIEKGLSSGGLDGGTSMRVLGNILSWMQEKTRPVFVAATANDIAMLPTELLRRGRFDEIFFLDIPDQRERQEIFKVHIARRGRRPQDYDLGQLADASDGFVGAEIEQAVVDAMFLAFGDSADPGRQFATSDIVTALEQMVPLTRSQAEKIQDMRQFLLDGRAKSASHKPPETNRQGLAH